MSAAVHAFGSSQSGDTAHTEPLATPSGSVLNGMLERSPVDVVFAERSLVPHENALANAGTQFKNSSAAVALLPAGPGRDFEFLCSRLPLSLASLAMAPESRCAVMLNSERVKEAGGFQDVDSPVRELIVRLALQNPDAVTLMDRDASDPAAVLNSLPPRNAALPLTAPDWPPRSHRWLASALSSLRIRDVLPDISSNVEATALHAGLWQTNDWLDESHSLSQSIEGKGDGTGDYWHGIMHRREPDAGNSKYWFRRVGRHECFEPLAKVASVALDECESPEAAAWKNRLGAADDWDPFAFVDLCQAASRGGDAKLAQAARRIQWAEMLILLAQP